MNGPTFHITQFGEERELRLTQTQYHDGSIAISAVEPDGGLWARVSVNLPIPPPVGSIWIKDYSENEGMAAALIEADIIEPVPTAQQPSGFVLISAYKLKNLDAIPNA